MSPLRNRYRFYIGIISPVEADPEFLMPHDKGGLFRQRTAPQQLGASRFKNCQKISLRAQCLIAGGKITMVVKFNPAHGTFRRFRAECPDADQMYFADPEGIRCSENFADIEIRLQSVQHQNALMQTGSCADKVSSSRLFITGFNVQSFIITSRHVAQ